MNEKVDKKRVNMILKKRLLIGLFSRGRDIAICHLKAAHADVELTRESKMSSEQPHVLSIQSHVVSGYVGNKSATFPLQVLKIIIIYLLIF